MATLPPPRGISERIKWMLANPPNKVGMCARTCWHALGGNRGNPPAWGAASANEVYDKAKASGRYFTGTPPKGALIIWKYGRYGHTAIAYNSAGTKIVTTDPSGKPGKTGIEAISYPHKWGASASNRIWTDQYNGVRFPVGEASSMATWMRYSGKPSGTLRVKGDGKYVTLDATVPKPPRSGREDRMVYLNIAPAWKLPKSDPLYYFQTASLRVRWTRAGDKPDRTAYQDFTITPWRNEFLVTHVHWEVGEKGRGGKWSFSLKGHVSTAAVSTRYSKSAVE
jgi:hypothetical protein